MWAEPDGEGLGPEERVSLVEVGDPVEAVGLARGLLRIAAIRATEEVLDAALRLVVALARVTVTGADGVSVSLRRRGVLTTVAASDETISGMDADQYATAEGPCVSAATDGRWFHVESLDDERRWPAFIPRARDRGINSILSTPLLTHARPVGALNIYSRRERAFAGPELELSTLFAGEASNLLVSAALDVSVEDLSRQLQDALRGRDSISQARGVLMERHHLSADAAYTRLRSSSQKTNRPIRRLAEEIMDSTQPRREGTAPDDA